MLRISILFATGSSESPIRHTFNVWKVFCQKVGNEHDVLGICFRTKEFRQTDAFTVPRRILVFTFAIVCSVASSFFIESFISGREKGIFNYEAPQCFAALDCQRYCLEYNPGNCSVLNKVVTREESILSATNSPMYVLMLIILPQLDLPMSQRIQRIMSSPILLP